MILHLRVVPGLWVAAEECRRPELRSQPLILGGLPRERGQVREANIAAQQHGVRPGMTLSQARHQCPDGLFLQPDLPLYDAVWERMCGALQAFTPLVEPLEMGQAVCDLEGCGGLWGDDLTAARSVQGLMREQTGITPWIGIASNRITAQLASLSVGSEGITVIGQGQEAAFLADLPITSLPDVDARLALTFQVLGLRTLGDLAALPVASVKQRFGARGEHLHRLASGIDPRPVLPPPARSTVEARDDLIEGTIAEALERLQRLADRCADDLQHRRLAGTMIELRLGAPHPPSPFRLRVGEGGTDCSFRAPPLPTNGGRGVRVGPGGKDLPVPYRIHSSRLPQPLASIEQIAVAEVTGNRAADGNAVLTGKPIAGPVVAEGLSPHGNTPAEGFRPTGKSAVTIVRTPINTAPALFEQAQRLLLQHWQKLEKPPEVIELIVSEFPRPRQLAFAELNRIGETGGLGGLDATRVQVIAESERALAARFGDATFRHVGHVDPGNILTERRFFWKHGLPWKGS
jgi:nucleotidyltransferase/DNA polymerase involved in DNA repair